MTVPHYIAMASRLLIFVFGIILMGLQAQDDPGSSQRLRQARALFEQRRFPEAAAAARQAIAQDKGNLPAWKLLGLALQLSQRYSEAAVELAEAVRRFPNDADLRFYLSRVRYLNHELRLAEESARKALQLKTDHADGFTQLGMILEAKLDFEAALDNYRRAIELGKAQQRSEPLPMLRAGELLLRLDRAPEALKFLTSAVEISSRSGSARIARALVLERLGRFDEAESEYQKALETSEQARARGFLDRLHARSAATAKSALPPEPLSPSPIRFENRAHSARLQFVLHNSATPKKYQVETMTGGVGVLDYNNDGWQDIFFVNGARLPHLSKPGRDYWNRLFRNNQDGTFTDVTEIARVAGEGYGMGVAAGDYDNDGDTDLFVAGVNRNMLFRNSGDGTFADATREARLEGIDPKRGKMWSMAAAWLDFDRDGDLDLFVANYCKWSPEIDPFCGAALPGYRTYCYPDRYEGLPNQLFKNEGNGTFKDVSVESGVAAYIGKGMGIAVADYDGDGWPDVFVANDTLPNFLFRNNGRGGFEEAALRAGIAVPENGIPVSSMGVDFRDYNNDGHPDLIVSALEGETFPVFRNLGNGFFRDETYSSRLGFGTARRSGWGLGLFDFNNDGHKDLFTVNAHVNDNIELFNEQTYRQPNSIFVNLGNGRFRDASAAAGADFQSKGAHRGCAFADFNNDGKMDAVTTSLNEPAELWINRSPDPNYWLMVKLVGTRSNRDGIGARVMVVTPSGKRLFNHATTSVGYASASDSRIHFGLGQESRAMKIEILWPSGALQTLREVPASRVLSITEPR